MQFNGNQVFMEDVDGQNKPVWVVFVVGALVIIVLLVFFGISITKNGISIGDYKKHNYVIQGVPPVTIYNHIGNNSYLVTSPAAATKSVLEFYGKEFTSEELKTLNDSIYNPNDPGKLNQLDSVTLTAGLFGFDTEIVTLSSADDFTEFISEDKQIPLIFLHNLTVEQPKEIKWTPFGVLIGVLESDNEFVFHDYYLGHNKHVSFEDFNILTNNKSNTVGVKYLAIKPNNFEYRSKVYDPYLERTESMETAATIINKITLARIASHQRLWDLQIDLSEEAIASPGFDEHVPPYYKIVAYAHAADGPLFLSEFPDIEYAEELTREAELLNFDLDKPWSDYWPGFLDMTNLIYDQSDAPFYLRGVISRMNGEYDKAIDLFQSALKVWPYSGYVKNQLNIAEELNSNYKNILKEKTKNIPNNESFKKTLVENSPWSVEWNRVSRTGTHKIEFMFDREGTVLKGNFFGSGQGTKSGEMKDITLKDGCIRFISSSSGNIYNYCLVTNGTLKGVMSGVSLRGESFVGEAIAKPAN